MEPERCSSRRHVEIHFGERVCIWRETVQSEMEQTLGGTRTNSCTSKTSCRDGWDELCSLETSWTRLTTNTTFHLAAPENVRPPTTREMLLHELNSANQCCNKDNFPLVCGQNLLEPPCEPLVRTEGNGYH